MLTNKEISEQIKKGNITIDNMKKDALEKPNSCMVSISDVLYTFDYSIVDTKEKNIYLQEVIEDKVNKLKRVKIPKEGLLLEPHKVYLAKTNEKIKTNGYIPVLNGRTSLSLLGVSIELTSGYGEDNYNGNFLLSIICTKPTIIYPNIEIGNLTFFPSLNYKSEKSGMLSGEEIKQRMKTGEIIITPQDNIVINPNSVNLSLNKKIGYYEEPILDLKKDNKISTVEISDNGLILYPDKIYVARSNEWTETENLVPMMSGRSSLGRLGLHVHCSAGMGSIGYKGYWHLGVRPSVPVKVYENMKVCQIYYFTTEGEIVNTYTGSMQSASSEESGSKFHTKMKKLEISHK